MKRKILIIDDEPCIQKVFSQWFDQEGFEHRSVSTLAEAHEAFIDECYDAILLDNLLPDGQGIDFLAEVRAACSTIAIIVITGAADVPLAVEAMYRGADYFLAKPVDFRGFDAILRKCLELNDLRRASQSRVILDRKYRVDFGISSAMRKVMELAGLAVGSDVSILITGETGVGKGVLAKWVHTNSTRSRMACVDVNCSVLRGDLLSSELFGHARGAFTSAVKDRAGLIEAANGGTLFLDEIGDMDLSVQAQLLKVVEEKQFRRLGEVRTRQSDFRLICATNRDLDREAGQGRFRKDLLYRIKGLAIHVPALRVRREDIPGLVRHLLVQCNYRYHEIAENVIELLAGNEWPGNVRELRNLLERAVLLSRGGPITLDHFSGLAGSATQADQDAHTSQARESGELARREQESLRSAMARFDGDVEQVAEMLGISRATVYRKLKKYRMSA